MKRTFLPILAICLALAFGCAPTQDMGGQPRKIPNPTVVSLSPGSTELVMAASFDALRGRTESCNYPMNVAVQPVVMNGVKPDWEKIASIKPNYVAYDADLFSPNDIAKLKELGPEPIEFKARTLEDYEKECHYLASFVGGETMMSEYLDKVYKELGLASGVLEGVATSPKVMILIGGGGRYMAAGDNSFQVNLIKKAGIATAAPQGDRFVDINVEMILQMNPDVILTDGKGQEILSDPRLKSVNALKNRKVSDVNADILLRKGGRVDQFYTAVRVSVSKAVVR